MRTIRLLFCDDNERDRTLIQKAKLPELWRELFQRDIQLDTCADIVEEGRGDNERRFADVKECDLLLLDISWPGQQDRGVVIAEEVRKRYPELPIVILSGAATSKHFGRLIMLGVSAFIPKYPQEYASWCVQMHDAWSRAYEDTSGQPLYREIRNVTKNTSAAWEASAVDEVASKMWLQESPAGKWAAFWEGFSSLLSRSQMLPAVQKLQERFREDELFTLGSNPGMRGHLEHVLNVYFTGYVVSHKIPCFRNAVSAAVRTLLREAYDDTKDQEYWELFQLAWLMAAPLHDAAYSLQVIPEVHARCKDIREVFQFLTAPNGQSCDASPGIDWGSRDGQQAKTAFESVIRRLYDGVPVDWIQRNATYVEQGVTKINHGVASGALFYADATQWQSMPRMHSNLPHFTQWAATAMALHSLKKAKGSENVRIPLKQDPLSFLLLLCDELQVWSRSRPDDHPGGKPWARVDLREFVCEDNGIMAEIEYVPYRGRSLNVKQDLAPLSLKLSTVQRELLAYAQADPIEMELSNIIRGHDYALPVIKL